MAYFFPHSFARKFARESDLGQNILLFRDSVSSDCAVDTKIIPLWQLTIVKASFFNIYFHFNVKSEGDFQDAIINQLFEWAQLKLRSSHNNFHKVPHNLSLLFFSNFNFSSNIIKLLMYNIINQDLYNQIVIFRLLFPIRPWSDHAPENMISISGKITKCDLDLDLWWY